MNTGNMILNRLLPQAYDRLVPDLEEVRIENCIKSSTVPASRSSIFTFRSIA